MSKCAATSRADCPYFHKLDDVLFGLGGGPELTQVHRQQFANAVAGQVVTLAFVRPELLNGRLWPHVILSGQSIGLSMSYLSIANGGRIGRKAAIRAVMGDGAVQQRDQ